MAGLLTLMISVFADLGYLHSDEIEIAGRRKPRGKELSPGAAAADRLPAQLAASSERGDAAGILESPRRRGPATRNARRHGQGRPRLHYVDAGARRSLRPA